MSAGELKRGDYQLIVRYGDFLNQQPELLQLIRSFGVEALPFLQPEQYGAFATALRGLGAQI